MKIGRTQLQDAVPMTLGQEFDAYFATVKEDVSGGRKPRRCSARSIWARLPSAPASMPTRAIPPFAIEELSRTPTSPLSGL